MKTSDQRDAMLAELRRRNELLEKNNALLEARLTEKNSPARNTVVSVPAAAVPATALPATALPAAASTPVRRPRRRAKRPLSNGSNAAASEDESPLKRRLSSGSSTRKKKPEHERKLRKLMGKVLKLNLDARLKTEFRDKDNFFLKGKFEDEVRPIVKYFHTSEEVDTKDMTLGQIFELAVSIAKSRIEYTPKAKSSSGHVKPANTPPTRTNYAVVKAKARSIYAQIVASHNSESAPNSPVANQSVRVAVAAAAAAGIAEAKGNAAREKRKAARERKAATKRKAAEEAAKEAARKAVSRAIAADAAEDVPTVADVRSLFEGDSNSDDEDLVLYNKKCQRERASAKKLLAIKKQEVLAAAKKKQEEKDKKKKEVLAAKEKKKKEAAARKEKKKQEAAAKKKAKKQKKQGKATPKNSPALNNYITAMGEAAVDASRAVSVEERNKADCLFKIGQNVSGYWPDGEDGGGWFNGTVVSLDYVHRTVHILYEDGDDDDEVPWHKARILDDITHEVEKDG